MRREEFEAIAGSAESAVYTGWNPRRHVDGLPDALVDFLGSVLPFPPGRPALADRYAGEAGYARAASSAAAALCAEGFLLEQDVEAAVSSAVARYKVEAGKDRRRQENRGKR